MTSRYVKAERSTGFTLVELLIVIVVIAILAAIIFVSYNGIRQRAHTSASQSAAEDVAKKIEMYHADKGSYPNLPFQINDLTYDDVAYVDHTISILAGDFSTYKPTDHEVGVLHCTSDGSNNSEIVGVKVFWYDYTKNQSDYRVVGDCSH